MVKRASLKSILLILVILQMILWVSVKKGMQQDDLLPQVLPLLLFISVIFWAQVVALIRYPKKMDRMDKFLIKYRPNLIKDVGKRRKAGVIFGLIVIIILFAVYTVMIVSYVCSNFLWIMNNFAKVTRILGLATLLGCISIFIWIVYKGNKWPEKVISKDNITMIGLIVENILISMILIIS